MTPELGSDGVCVWDAATFIESCAFAPPVGIARSKIGPSASGFEWRDEIGHWCLLTHVTAVRGEEARPTQTRLVLEGMDAALGALGLSFHDVVRTWFFLDEILRWYDDFNRERTRFFTERGLLSRMPASTAVGPAVHGGPPLVGALLALRPESGSTIVSSVPSPAQGSAFDYGSSFSRAMEVSWPRGKRLFVSGTASIDAVGRTVHPGNLSAQFDETFRVVGQLLASRGFSFDDVTHAVRYFAQHGEGGLGEAGGHFSQKFSNIQATICRADLAFELELVAERRLGR